MHTHTHNIYIYKGRGGGGGGRTETDNTIEKGVVGVGEGSVCALVQNIGGWGGGASQAELDSLCEQLVRSVLVVAFFWF